MSLVIHGRPGSRARRPLWVLRELDVPFENVVPEPGAVKQSAFLAINPNGKVPVLEEDGFVLFESFAQALYLAKKHGAGTLYPADPQGEALAWQWTFWALNELERPLTTCLFERVLKPEADRDPAAAAMAEEQLQAPLGVLDAALSGRTWLLGDTFTVADINVAAVLALSRAAKVAIDARHNVNRWLDAALARPAYGS